MKKKFLKFLMGCSLLINCEIGQAQTTPEPCGTMEFLTQQFKVDPDYKSRLDQLEKQTKAYIANYSPASQRRLGTITIPVVVHIVSPGPTMGYVTDQQVHSQITALNRDFSKSNSDIANVPAAFVSLAADIQIQFQLASILRASTSLSVFEKRNIGDINKIGFSPMNSSAAWDRDRYLNIWVCDLEAGFNGYGAPPLGDPRIDGVVLDYQVFGTQGTVLPNFNLGRTAVHEVGHWLNLKHIFGESHDANGYPDCNDDDEVSDTPKQQGPNYNCPSFPTNTQACDKSLPNGTMFMNFMDYTDQSCSLMFTEGQKRRMEAALEYGGRKLIGCNSTYTMPSILTISGQTDVDCLGELTYTTESLPNTAYSWSLPSGWSVIGSANESVIKIKQNSNPSLPATISVTATSSCNPAVTRNGSLTITGIKSKLSPSPTVSGVPTIMCPPVNMFDQGISIQASHPANVTSYKFEIYPGHAVNIKESSDNWGSPKKPSILDQATHIRTLIANSQVTLIVADANYSGYVNLKVYAYSPSCNDYSDPAEYSFWVGSPITPNFTGTTKINASAGSQFNLTLTGGDIRTGTFNLVYPSNWILDMIGDPIQYGFGRYLFNYTVTIPPGTPNRNYNISTSTSNACGTTVSNLVTVCVGGGCRFSSAGTNYSIYPNPATDIVNITAEKKNSVQGQSIKTMQSLADYNLFNNQGKVVRKGKLSSESNSIETMNLPKGLYYLHINSGNEIIKEQIIIQ
ncbi:M43 family zinc metalloprotease [Adhaeribacter soli]|uniref:T9SS type A sorting domain-containing protein n=1 Tax=Adhaeribacter soli TaxID=2607655 RepID=A0A5N1III7_9BACT|nr:M43 family zinc metalloprotease [Adhaeribacter soli]KAA9325475.1 T9SS type A sorting domain-containing protein [Adhaeribacter soli]